MKRHTLNVTALCSALPGGEAMLAALTVTGVLLCLLLAPHLPHLAGRALWGAVILTLLTLADHTDMLPGLCAYVLTARIRRCSSRTRPEQPAASTTPH